MSTIRGSESFPGSFFSYILLLAQLALGVALHPVPVLTSSDVDGTLFIRPLAYLATTLFAAVYFNQIWLFVLSAFGVVWLDAQLAWRAEALGNMKMKQYIDEQVERGLAPPPYEEVHEKELVEKLVDPQPELEQSCKEPSDVVTEKPITPVNPMKHLTGEKDMSSVISSHISTATLCVLPAQVMETHFTPEQTEILQAGIEPSIQQQQQGCMGSSPLRREILQTVLEEDEATEDEDEDPRDNIDLMRDMEAVHQELAKVWGARLSRPFPGKEELASSESGARTRGAPPEVPPRPKAPRPVPAVVIEEIPALPEPEDENLALSITSMEELQEPGSSASSVRSFGDFVEAPAPLGGGSDPSRPSTSHSTTAKKEIPHFPIIDDVLSEYEASMHTVERERNQVEYVEDHEGLTSGDESRNGFSDDSSRCDSPASSASSANDDVYDMDIPALDVKKETAVAVDVEVQPVKDEVDLQQANVIVANAQPKRPSLPCRASSSRSSSSRPKRAPKKNNGWKRVPKKARLSPKQKKRFISRAFW